MRHLFLFFFFLSPLSLLAGGPKRELRGIWVATVSNIDWPSPRNYNAYKQKEEFIDLLNSHQKTGFNAIFVQVRTAADAFYAKAGGGKWVASETVVVGSTSIEVHFIRHPRARVFRLTLCRDGSGRVTLPRFGSMPGARNFLLQHVQWLADRAQIQQANTGPTDPSKGEIQIRFRGEFEGVTVSDDGKLLHIGTLSLPMPRLRDRDLPAKAQAALQRLAQRELPERVQQLSATHGIAVSAISIRAQRTRWGSCSPRGEISLNWRLVQVPEGVRDYVILHELAHRRHLNHSARFWQEVERLCPDYEAAETWLRETGRHVL